MANILRDLNVENDLIHRLCCSGCIKFGGEHNRIVTLNLDLSLHCPLLSFRLDCSWREDCVKTGFLGGMLVFTPPKIIYNWYNRVWPIVSITFELCENGNLPPRKSTQRGKGPLFFLYCLPYLTGWRGGGSCYYNYQCRDISTWKDHTYSMLHDEWLLGKYHHRGFLFVIRLTRYKGRLGFIERRVFMSLSLPPGTFKLLFIQTMCLYCVPNWTTPNGPRH